MKQHPCGRLFVIWNFGWAFLCCFCGFWLCVVFSPVVSVWLCIIYLSSTLLLSLRPDRARLCLWWWRVCVPISDHFAQSRTEEARQMQNVEWVWHVAELYIKPHHNDHNMLLLTVANIRLKMKLYYYVYVPAYKSNHCLCIIRFGSSRLLCNDVDFFISPQEDVILCRGGKQIKSKLHRQSKNSVPARRTSWILCSVELFYGRLHNYTSEMHKSRSIWDLGWSVLLVYNVI